VALRLEEKMKEHGLESPSLFGSIRPHRVTVIDIQAAKDRGEKWPMLTSYDALTAEIFDAAGVPVLLSETALRTTCLVMKTQLA
jgi:hypothetical protein